MTDKKPERIWLEDDSENQKNGTMRSYTDEIHAEHIDFSKRNDYPNNDTPYLRSTPLLEHAEEMRELLQEAFNVSTEPGVMDIDEWKVWKKQTDCAIHKLLTFIEKAEEERKRG